MRRTIASALIAGLAAFFSLAVPSLSAAGETSPYYPGSTLTVKLASKPRAGKVTTLIASGENSAGELNFGLEMFAKLAREDPTCMPTYEEELNSSINERGESSIYQGESAEARGPFKLDVKAEFNPVKVVICAYSIYVTDTAANDRIVFTVPAAKKKGHHKKHR
jgi:hypothetical protein